jgi:hypothetical protein
VKSRTGVSGITRRKCVPETCVGKQDIDEINGPLRSAPVFRAGGGKSGRKIGQYVKIGGEMASDGMVEILDDEPVFSVTAVDSGKNLRRSPVLKVVSDPVPVPEMIPDYQVVDQSSTQTRSAKSS